MAKNAVNVDPETFAAHAADEGLNDEQARSLYARLMAAGTSKHIHVPNPALRAARLALTEELVADEVWREAAPFFRLYFGRAASKTRQAALALIDERMDPGEDAEAGTPETVASEPVEPAKPKRQRPIRTAADMSPEELERRKASLAKAREARAAKRAEDRAAAERAAAEQAAAQEPELVGASA